MTKKFKDFMQEKFASTYNGLDDNSPDAFDRYLQDISIDDIIEYFDTFSKDEKADSQEKQKVFDTIYNLI